MKTIGFPTFEAIYCFLDSCFQLGLNAQRNDLLGDINEGIKYTILAAQRDLLKTFLEKGLVPQEVGTCARRVHKVEDKVKVKDKVERRCRKTEKYILNERIWEKEELMREKKFSWSLVSKKAEKPLSREMIRWYREIKGREMNRVWEREKRKKKVKIEWLELKMGRNGGERGGEGGRWWWSRW